MEILRFSFHRKSHSPNNGSHFARPAHSPFPVGRSSYSILDAPETRNAPSMSNGNPSRDADGGDDDETSQVAIGFIIARSSIGRCPVAVRRSVSSLTTPECTTLIKATVMKGRLKGRLRERGKEEGGREISAKSLPFKCPHSIHSAPLLAGRKAGRQAYYLQGCPTKTTPGCASRGCSSARPCNIDLFLPVAQVLRPSRLREHGWIRDRYHFILDRRVQDGTLS